MRMIREVIRISVAGNSFYASVPVHRRHTVVRLCVGVSVHRILHTSMSGDICKNLIHGRDITCMQALGGGGLKIILSHICISCYLAIEGMFLLL